MSEEIKFLSLALQSSLLNLLDNFMKSNQNNVDKQETIQPWLSFKNPKLSTIYSFLPAKPYPKPEYQVLRTDFFSNLFRKNNSKLKIELEVFENLYRTFEETLYLNILIIIPSKLLLMLFYSESYSVCL